MPCPWDTPIPIYSVSQFHVHLGVEIETDDIFMSPGHRLVHVHTNRTMSLGHTHNLHSVSKLLVYNGIKIETDDTFMSPGHILVPVHTKLAGSLGHTDTFTFCIKIPSISRHQDAD